VTTADTGDYSVVVNNSAGTLTSDVVHLLVNKAAAVVTLDDLSQSYDGTPKPVSVTTIPGSLNVVVTYDGASTPPTNPGSYAVVATIDDPNHAGSANGTLVVTITGLVRHAPVLNGQVEGSLQILSGESFALNSSKEVSGDVLVPGTPTVWLNGAPTYGGTLDGSGSAAPAGQQITLNSGAALRHIVRRTDPIALAAVSAPPAPTGTRNVSINSAGQSAGDFMTLRNLTLNSNVGQVVVPPGTYGNFTTNGGSGLTLGVVGTSEPAVYNLQALKVNSGARIEIVGPVILTVASGISLNAVIGDAAHPEWLTLRVAAGGVTLNTSATLDALVLAPAGTVTLNTNSRLTGRIACDRLTINTGGLLRELTQ
jgi:rhamnogalacturonan endolyase